YDLALAQALAADGGKPGKATKALKGPKLSPDTLKKVRRIATKDASEEARGVAVKALRMLAPDDADGLDLAMKLAAAQVKAGDLKELAVKLPRGQAFPMRDKRIAQALYKRVEKEP